MAQSGLFERLATSAIGGEADIPHLTDAVLLHAQNWEIAETKFTDLVAEWVRQPSSSV